jgi:hypothetical protein
MVNLEDLAGLIAASASGIIIGFLAVGIAARTIDTIESKRCPESSRIEVNNGTILKEWAAWKQCPR